MIIDAHSHISFRPAQRDRHGLESLLASMNRAKIDLSLVLASPNDACSTERLLKAIGPYPERFRAVGSVQPLNGRPKPAKVRSWLRRGLIVGLKFYTGYEHFYPADPSLAPYLDLLTEYHRPAVFHCGDTLAGHPRAKLKYSHPLNVDELAIDRPSLKIVIAHLGWPWVIDAAEVCAKNPNVFADCSGFVYGGFDDQDRRQFKRVIAEFVRVAGSTAQVMFGTDWPVGDQGPYLTAARRIWRRDDPVFAATAQQVFGLEI